MTRWQQVAQASDDAQEKCCQPQPSRFPGLSRAVHSAADRLYRWLESLRQRIRGGGLPLLFGRLLLIYQMPKTGSQTVEATLEHCTLPHRILRFHYLSTAMAAEIRRGPVSNRAPDLWAESVRPQLAFMARMSRILVFRRILRWCRVPIPKIEVITAVREPIGLALSSVFENHPCFFSSLEAATLEDFSSVLSRPRLYRFQDWFDMELEAFTGLQVYRTPFPRARGYAITSTLRASGSLDSSERTSFSARIETSI